MPWPSGNLALEFAPGLGWSASCSDWLPDGDYAGGMTTAAAIALLADPRTAPRLVTVGLRHPSLRRYFIKNTDAATAARVLAAFPAAAEASAAVALSVLPLWTPSQEPAI
jgi:hypothetical protein